MQNIMNTTVNIKMISILYENYSNLLNRLPWEKRIGGFDRQKVKVKSTIQVHRIRSQLPYITQQYVLISSA